MIIQYAFKNQVNLMKNFNAILFFISIIFFFSFIVLLFNFLFLTNDKVIINYKNTLNLSNQNYLIEKNFNVYVISNKINVFSKADESSQIIATFIYGTKLQVIDEENDFYKISFENNNVEELGYVLKSFVLNTNITSQIIYIDTNATIVKTCKTYDFINGQYIEKSTTLENNTRVKLLNGYNSNIPYQQISYQLNEKIITCYIPTNSVEADGLNQRALIAFMLIIVCVSLFLILYGFYRGKKNKKIRKKLLKINK